MVDVDRSRGGGSSVLEDRDRARPGLDVSRRDKIRCRSCRGGSTLSPAGTGPGRRRQQGATDGRYSETADEASGQDDQDPQMDEVRPEKAQDTAASPKEQVPRIGLSPGRGERRFSSSRRDGGGHLFRAAPEDERIPELQGPDGPGRPDRRPCRRPCFSLGRSRVRLQTERFAPKRTSRARRAGDLRTCGRGGAP